MPSSGLKIYIGNLPDNLNQEDIRDYFSKYGTILNMELKGNYGFIEYEDRRMCEEAISQLHGTEFKGSQLRVEFAHGEKNGNNNFNKYKESKSCDTCFKCGQVGHWARECHNSGNAREFGSRKPGGNRYEDRRNNETYTTREPYNSRDNRDKYDRDERYPPPPPLERGGYERPYERYGRGDPPEIEYRREYRNYDRPYDRERDNRPYDRPFPEREYERYNRDNYERPYYPPPPPLPLPRDSRDGYEREIYDRRPLPPPDVPPYPPRGRTGSPPPPPPPRRSSYDRGVREVAAPLPYRGRSPLPPPRYQPDPMFGPPPIRPPSPRGGPIYRRRSSMSPIRGPGSGGSGGRGPLIYSGRPPRSPSPIARNIHTRRSGPRTPSPSH